MQMVADMRRVGVKYVGKYVDVLYGWPLSLKHGLRSDAKGI